VVDDMAGQFMQAVSEARNLELSRVQQLATGEVFSGRQAMEHGLVDELTGEEGATNWLAEQLHVEPDALELVTLTKSPGIWSRFSPGGTGALLNSLLGLSPTLPMAIYPHHGPRGH
jgi:protease-4